MGYILSIGRYIADVPFFQGASHQVELKESVGDTIRHHISYVLLVDTQFADSVIAYHEDPL